MKAFIVSDWDNTISEPSLPVTHPLPSLQRLIAVRGGKLTQRLLLTPFPACTTNTGGGPGRRWKAELFSKQARCGTPERKICLRAARSGMPVRAGAAFPREAGFLRGQELEPGREPRGKPAAPLLSLIKQWLSPPTRERLLRSLFWQGCSGSVNSVPCFVIWDDFKSLFLLFEVSQSN